MIEIIAATLEDALKIEEYGGNRIELVSALSEGGLTPSYGLIEEVVKRTNIPVNVMIRPHSNSFMYSRDEIAIMKKDILIAKNLKVNGVVFGVLNQEDEICEKSLKALLSVCGGIDVTFHKAIDETLDQINSIKILTKYSEITNVLTSGGKGNITDNIDVLKGMVDSSKHIKILPGGGLKFSNIEEIISGVKASQYHFGTAVRENNSYCGAIDGEKLIKLERIV